MRLNDGGNNMTTLKMRTYVTLFEEEFSFKRTKLTFMQWIIKKWKGTDYQVRLNNRDLEFILNNVLRLLAIPVGEHYRLVNQRGTLKTIDAVKEEEDNTTLYELMEDLAEIVYKYEHTHREFLFER